MLERHGKNISDPISGDEFITLLETDDQKTLDLLETAGAAVHQVRTYMPLFFWLVDDSVAIFAILSLSKRAIEHGFRTIDEKLITALLEMRDRYHNGPSLIPGTGQQKDRPAPEG